MDENTALKLRIMALESTVRKMDRLLCAVCKKLENSSYVDQSVSKAAQDYLKVFQDENIRKV